MNKQIDVWLAVYLAAIAGRQSNNNACETANKGVAHYCVAKEKLS